MLTNRVGGPAEYIGADLTSRYSKKLKPVDVAGLDAHGSGGFTARFWTWEWRPGGAGLDVTAIAGELTSARASMLDGPQGLATKGNTMRLCERAVGAVGKTPDVRPARNRPFSTYIWSSLDLFQALGDAHLLLSPQSLSTVAGIHEMYPGHSWRTLVGYSLPSKHSATGQACRHAILEILGVRFPNAFEATDDKYDACLGAILAAGAHGQVKGLSVKHVGTPLGKDTAGTLREGPMVVPVLDVGLRAELAAGARLAAGPDGDVDVRPRPVREATAVDPEYLRRANLLLANLVGHAAGGNAELLSYQTAYQEIVQKPVRKWSQGFHRQIESIAKRTTPVELPNLGWVRLDSFVVNKRTHFPGEGHWTDVAYPKEDWERVLGTATLRKGEVGRSGRHAVSG